MLRHQLCHTIVLICLCVLCACSEKEMPDDFQTNHSAGFELMELFYGFGSLEAAWNNIDPEGVNERLERAINKDIDEFEIFSRCFADILGDSAQPVSELVKTDLGNTIARLIDTKTIHLPKENIGAFYTNQGEAYRSEFYSFLDNMTGSGTQVPDGYFNLMNKKIIDYLIDSIPQENGAIRKAWLNEKMTDMMEELRDDEFQEDFTDLSKLLGRLLIRSDYPMWIDGNGIPLNHVDIDSSVHKNLNLGNAAEGTPSIVLWLNRVVKNPQTREAFHTMVQGLANIFDPDPGAETGQKLRDLICNLEDHFTVGGEVYDFDPVYSENSDKIYSDAELGQSVRELFPSLMQLFLRSDRQNAIIEEKDGKKVYPMDLAGRNLRGMGFDPDTIDVDRSIYDMLRYDVWGRDRLNDNNAWPASFFESLIFLTHATSHHGWKKADTNEVTNSSDPRADHGHGTYIEDLTLNDSLFSIKTHKTADLGIYDISLQQTDGNHIYRTKTSFRKSEIDGLYSGTVTGGDKDYRLFYDQDYGVLQFLAGPGPGDLGTPDGGNPDGNSVGLNQYFAYAPKGLHETQLSSWTMGWGVRACFGGEGPYYYADPDAQTVNTGGQIYYKYFRPDGKVYALVNSDRTSYLYPTEDGDAEDEDTAKLPYNYRRQRANRYKSQWQSDYYMSHYSGLMGEEYYTIDNSSGDTVIKQVSDAGDQAGCLTYRESVTETDPDRACASQEEAFFRNFQWVMTEKKMVLIIPLYLELELSGIGLGKGVVFQILECHGWSGLADIRIFEDNHVWAKKGESGNSTIPGDYRMEVVSNVNGLGSILVNTNTIYNNTLDCGNATPSIVGHNLPALYRLGFPRSPEIYRGNGVYDKELGSKDFEVGDEIWNKRNAFMPMLFSLLAGLREYTPEYDPDSKPGINSGMRSFLNSQSLLIKPLFYYRRDIGDYPRNTWVPRVYGTSHYGDFEGDPFLQSSAEFYNNTPDAWYGSWEERRHYQPAVKKSLLNMLIDSDLTDPEKRCNGLLPLLAETKTISSLMKVLLEPSSEAFNLEQVLSAVKFTKGELIRINESPAANKGAVFPDWMFAKGVEETKDIYGAYTQYTNVRKEDFILDDLLDVMIGYDAIDDEHTGYGLAEFPDEKHYDEDWEEFNEDVEILSHLVHENSQFGVTQNLLSMIDRMFGKDEAYTSNEISGFLYSLGKLFAYYDSDQNRWVYQGQNEFNDIYNILALRLPVIHDIILLKEVDFLSSDGAAVIESQPGDNYYAQLVMISNMFAEDGLVEFLLNTVTVPYNWETILFDLDLFLGSFVIVDPDTPLWPTLANLLNDMGKAAGDAQDNVALDGLYEEYGFQVN